MRDYKFDAPKAVERGDLFNLKLNTGVIKLEVKGALTIFGLADVIAAIDKEILTTTDDLLPLYAMFARIQDDDDEMFTLSTQHMVRAHHTPYYRRSAAVRADA